METAAWQGVEARVIEDIGHEDVAWNRGKAGSQVHHFAPRGHAASVNFEEGQKLRDLVIESKRDTLVEVGTNRGFSTLWIMLGMLKNDSGHLTTFDIVDAEKEYGVPYWKQYGLPKELVTYVQKPIWGNPPELPSQVDFVFVDSSHEVGETLQELEALTPRVPIGGIMVFHDIFLCWHMGREILRWFTNKPGWTYEEWEYGRGLGIARHI